MLNKSLKYPKIALINTNNKDFFGYKLVLDQEKIPYSIINTLKDNWDLVILPNDHSILLRDLLDFVFKGGFIVSSFNFLDDEPVQQALIIPTKFNTYQPYGKGVIYYFSYNFGEQALQTYFYSDTHKRNILSQSFGYFNHNLIENTKRVERIKFKNILYRLLGPLTQIWYWPEPYSSCYCQRVDVDFPITLFHKKNMIIDKMFDLIKEFPDINFSLFLNGSFPKQNEHIKLLAQKYPNIELQSHSCSSTIKHRDYCYSLDLLQESEILEMLSESFTQTSANIFAPPCEQVNKYVLDACQKLSIKFISAGGIGKDDIPRKCYFDNKEYDIFNIPTSFKEFLSYYEPRYYTQLLMDTVNDSSLFCIFFHPYILLNKHTNKKLSKFLYYSVVEKQSKNKMWIPFMSELANWWLMRDGVAIVDGNISYRDEHTREFFLKSKYKLSVVKWYPDHIKKIL